MARYRPDETLPKPKPRQREHKEQASYFAELKLYERTMPELARVHAIPNGARVGRDQAKKLVREGLKAGVPDVFIPLARGGYYGCYIEFKAPPDLNGKSRGAVKEHQSRFMQESAKEGYLCLVVDDAATAVSLTLAYTDRRKLKARAANSDNVEDHRTHRRRI